MVGRVKERRAFRVTLDGKRRPTLPAALLDDAGVDATRVLIARVDGPGRIVLEDPAVALAAFQAQVAEGKRARGFDGDLADDLLTHRAADHTLD